jgi:hypothetical protein
LQWPPPRSRCFISGRSPGARDSLLDCGGRGGAGGGHCRQRALPGWGCVISR